MAYIYPTLVALLALKDTKVLTIWRAFEPKIWNKLQVKGGRHKLIIRVGRKC